MVAFSWVIIKLMDRGDNNAWDYGLMLAVWAVPFFTVPLGRPAFQFRACRSSCWAEGSSGGCGYRPNRRVMPFGFPKSALESGNR